MIKRGGKTFQDVMAVTAWVHTFKNKDRFLQCPAVTMKVEWAVTYATGLHVNVEHT